MRTSNLNFNWVITNKLAIGLPPSSKENLLLLKKMGIKSILSLCDENEHKWSEELMREFHCKRYILPDHKFNRLPEVFEIMKAIKITEQLIKGKGPLFIHCFAAVERSPLVCMAWLVKHKNIEPLNALIYLKEINPSTNPSSKQFEVIKKISNNL